MRTFGSYMAVGILAFAVGCGGSSGGSGGPDGGGSANTGRSPTTGGQCPAGSTTGQTCTGQDAYNTCVQNACGTQIAACLGNGYASGTYTGPCADYVNCTMKCPCDATAQTCEATCSTQYMTATSTCYTCMMTVATCVLGAGCAMPTCGANTATATSTATKTTTSTGTGTSTGTANCAALSACCASIVAMAGGGVTVQECQAAYAAVPDATCATLLSTYKTAGVCK